MTVFLAGRMVERLRSQSNISYGLIKTQQRVRLTVKTLKVSKHWWNVPPEWPPTAYDKSSFMVLENHSRHWLVCAITEKVPSFSIPGLSDFKDTKRQHPPSHSLFTLLPSDNRYRSICCSTTRLQSRFIRQTVRLLNLSATSHHK